MSSSVSEHSSSEIVTNLKFINPGSKTSTPKLDEENFLMWKFQVLITLRGHGLYKFIDSDYDVPSKFLNSADESSSTRTSNPEYDYWIRQDNLITAWLLSSMNTAIVAELLDCKTSREVWSHLSARFSSKHMARVLELKTKLGTTKKGTLGLQEYFTKIKNLVDALAVAGHSISHSDHVLYILGGLGPEYDPTVSVLTGDDTFPPLQRIYSMLLTQESRIQRHSSSSVNPDGTLPSVNLTQTKIQQPTPVGNDGNQRNKNQGSQNNQSNQGRGQNTRSNRRNWNNNKKPQCQL